MGGKAASGAETSKALVMAINDEYKARATHQAVVNKFGPVAPFTNIG